jgi:hypothetical protein
VAEDRQRNRGFFSDLVRGVSSPPERSGGLKDPNVPLPVPTGVQLLNLRSSWKVSSANYFAMTEVSEACSLASTRNPYVIEKVFVQTMQQIRLAIMLYSDTARKSVSAGVRTS